MLAAAALRRLGSGSQHSLPMETEVSATDSSSIMTSSLPSPVTVPVHHPLPPVATLEPVKADDDDDDDEDHDQDTNNAFISDEGGGITSPPPALSSNGRGKPHSNLMNKNVRMNSVYCRYGYGCRRKHSKNPSISSVIYIKSTSLHN